MRVEAPSRQSIAGADAEFLASRNTSFDACISYSHAADGKLAPFQSALQSFAKPWYQRRALRILRDQTSLSAPPALWPKIAEALASGRYFVLLAACDAAMSRWVSEEVEWWLSQRSPSNLFIVITDGNLARNEGDCDFDWSRTDALPAILSRAFDAEPLWIDLRWARAETHLSPKDPELTILLSQQAIKTSRTPQAEDSLRRGSRR